MFLYYTVLLKKMVSKTLNKSEIKEINQKTQELYEREFLSKKDFVQLIEKPIKHIKNNKKTTLFFYEDKPLPTLKILQKENFLKKITVDMGAVKFVCNGADIMRPGIVEIDQDIEKNEIITIIDEKNKMPIAIGQTKHTGQELQEMKDGKVIKNIHYVTDEIWQLE